MLRKRLVTSACAAAILTVMSATPVRAQSPGGPIDARTEFTFSQPVEMPGVTLPPGAYIFRFADPTSRKVMQVVTNDASKKSYGLFQTITAQRPTSSDEAELRFLETPAGQPAAVKTWWYPGNSIGREFIYPKSQAVRLAKATNQQVLTTDADNVSTEQMQTAELAYVSPSGQETAVTAEQQADTGATTQPVGTAGASAPAQEGTMAANRTSLPRTSTVLPMIGLLGLMSLLGGAALRFRQ